MIQLCTSSVAFVFQFRSDIGEWIEVDLIKDTVVSGVITQGDPWSSFWTTKYKVAYRSLYSTASDYKYVSDANGNTKV